MLILGVSLPLRERGLKFAPLKFDHPHPRVAPLAGAWIEIGLSPTPIAIAVVAPLAGAWIEMLLSNTICA